MCGFIAQLVEHRTGIAEVMGSNPVEALIFFRLLLSNCLNWKIYYDDHTSLSTNTLLPFHRLRNKPNKFLRNFSRLNNSSNKLIVTCAVYSMSMKSIFVRAVIGSPGVVTHSINAAIVCSVGALVCI